ncbi:hypothetical protein AGLY_011723, partial [Aphis glycines]
MEKKYLLSNFEGLFLHHGKSSSLHPIGIPLYPVPTIFLSGVTIQAPTCVTGSLLRFATKNAVAIKKSSQLKKSFLFLHKYKFSLVEQIAASNSLPLIWCSILCIISYFGIYYAKIIRMPAGCSDLSFTVIFPLNTYAKHIILSTNGVVTIQNGRHCVHNFKCYHDQAMRHELLLSIYLFIIYRILFYHPITVIGWPDIGVIKDIFNRGHRVIGLSLNFSLYFIVLITIHLHNSLDSRSST